MTKLLVTCACGTPNAVMEKIEEAVKKEGDEISDEFDSYVGKSDKHFLAQTNAIESWMKSSNQSYLDSFAD